MVVQFDRDNDWLAEDGTAGPAGFLCALALHSALSEGCFV